MANRYWVQGSGNWSDNANHWSATSGGSPGASKPTSADNVYFDANSFSSAAQTVVINESAYCADMDWTGAGYSPSLDGAFDKFLTIYGSLTYISEMSVPYSGIIIFSANVAGKTIRTNGLSLANLAILFQGGPNNTLLLQDDLTTTGYLIFQMGSFNSGDKKYYLWRLRKRFYRRYGHIPWLFIAGDQRRFYFGSNTFNFQCRDFGNKIGWQ